MVAGGCVGHGEVVSLAVSDEEVAHGAAKSGKLGEILDDVVLRGETIASSSAAR